MRRVLPTAIALLAPVLASAQETPFDMSPERPATQQAPQPPEMRRPAPPINAPDAGPPEVEQTPPVAPPAAEAPVAVAPTSQRRNILSEPLLRLAGESDRRSWAIYLTQAQASAAATLDLAYRNAVIVAPEASHLLVTINGTQVLDDVIQSSDDFSGLRAAIPTGVLQPGRNEIAVSAVQRHRTDCSIASTYELWTEIDANQTYLSLEGPAGAGELTLADLRTLSSDMSGSTAMTVVAPELTRADIGGDVLRLAQAVALTSGQPQPRFEIVGNVEDETGDPQLRIFVGTVAEIADAAGVDAPDVSGPTTIVRSNDDGTMTLVLTGPQRQDWRAALDEMAAAVDRPAGSRRSEVVTEMRQTPNPPIIHQGGSISFADLGFRSEQFAGRRYTRALQVGIPSDFYANSYGQAEILLDAAYTDSVLPGGLINVYVNGNIATSVPITSQRGSVLDRFPVRVTMEHFRPGVNTILLEVDLLSQVDDVCAPGAPTDDTPRFALFDTSELVFPDFARIGQMPNLSALAGTGFPYNRSDAPIPVMVGQGGTPALSAAADLMGQIALAAGRVVPVEKIMSPENAAGRHAIFVGTPAAIPASVLSQVGLDAAGASGWAPIAAGNLQGTAPGPAAAPVTMDSWRQQMTEGWLSRTRNAVEQWITTTFDLTVDMVRFAPRQDPDYVPATDDAFIVAQGVDPSGEASWVVVTAPDDAGLARGSQMLATGQDWMQLSGHLTAFPAGDQPARVLDGGQIHFLQSQPASFANYRLIAANWLSGNILSYALALIVLCVVSGISTSRLLARLGRRN